MPGPMNASIVHNKDMHRFELPISGEDIAAAYYRVDENGHLVLVHTEVPSEYSGQGIASKLALGLFEMARTEGWKLVLRCPFMQGWFSRHPEFGDVVAG